MTSPVGGSVPPALSLSLIWSPNLPSTMCPPSLGPQDPVVHSALLAHHRGCLGPHPTPKAPLGAHTRPGLQGSQQVVQILCLCLLVCWEPLGSTGWGTVISVFSGPEAPRLLLNGHKNACWVNEPMNERMCDEWGGR